MRWRTRTAKDISVSSGKDTNEKDIFNHCVHHFNKIDLAEVQSVASAPPAQVGTKKIDERAFFDVSI